MDWEQHQPENGIGGMCPCIPTSAFGQWEFSAVWVFSYPAPGTVMN